MKSCVKTKFLILCASLVLPFAVHAQTYKVGDRFPGGGIVVEVDGSGKKGMLVDEVDSGPYTPPEAISAAKAKGAGWAVPYLKHLKVVYANVHKAGNGNFKPALYQSVDASSPQYRRGLNFADGTESTGIAQNNKVLVRYVKSFDTSAVATASVFPLSRETRFEPGRKYPSPSGNHYLIFQTDGNLVVYTKQDKPVWGLNSLAQNWRNNGYAVFQSDGNLATYQSDKAYVWSARQVQSPAGTTLTLNDRGELQINGPDGKALWTGTAN